MANANIVLSLEVFAMYWDLIACGSYV